MRGYGLSRVGQYHLDAGSDVCQDAYALAVDVLPGVSIGVVSDGVGSELYSDIASKTAVRSCLEYCIQFYDKIEDNLSLLNNAFMKAYFDVEEESKNRSLPIDQMDCTLCAVIYTENCVYTGNIGDSGAIGLSVTGEYIKLTDQHNDDDGNVYTLIFKSRWEFKKIDVPLVSILLATDGFYNFLYPPYLTEYNESGVPTEKYIDYGTVCAFMDPDDPSLKGSEEELSAYVSSCVDSIPKTGNWDGINDDLTVVGILTDKTHDICADYSKPIDYAVERRRYSDYVKKILYHKKGSSKSNHDSDSEPIFEKNNESVRSITVDEARLTEIRSDHNPYRITEKSVSYLVDNEIFVFFDREYLQCNMSALVPKINDILNHKLPSTLIGYIQWPQKKIVDACGNLIGYTSRPLDYTMLFDDMYPNLAEYDQRVAASLAYNLASTYVALHQDGISLGALEGSNIAVTQQCGIAFVNLDPEEISIGREWYSQPGFVWELPPDFKTKERLPTAAIDSLSLSLHIFRLFMLGHDPYTPDGVPKYVLSIGENEGEHLFDREDFPPYIMELFERCFNTPLDQEKPDTSNWASAMDHYTIDFKPCDSNSAHIYWSGSSSCPYCKYQTLIRKKSV